MTSLYGAEIDWAREILEEAEAIVQAEWLRVVLDECLARRDVADGLAAQYCRTRLRGNDSGALPASRPRPESAALPPRRAPKRKVRATQRSPPSPRREWTSADRFESTEVMP